MTRYFKNLGTIFDRAGVNVTGENGQDLDRAIHKVVEVKYKDCPRTWRQVRNRVLKDERSHIRP